MEDTLCGILLDHAGRRPERLYVRCVFPNGEDSRLTYGGLVERGSRFARACADAGATPGGIVLVILPHSVDLYCAFFGAMLGGYVPSMLAVPSFKLNPEHYRHELESLLRRVEARAVITDTATSEHLALEDGRFGGARVILADADCKLQIANCKLQIDRGAAEDVVLLQHSSGSTGLKKGVALSNRAVLNQVRAYASTLDLREDDRIASWLPLYHDMGLIACAVMPLILEIPVSAVSPFHWVTAPASLLRLIDEDRCTLAWMPNFAYEFLATRVRNSQIQGLRLDSMRGWINCSEPTVARSHRHFLERYAPLGVRPETLWTCYAAAETTFAVTQSSARVPARIEQIDRERYQVDHLAVPGAGAAVETMSGGSLIPEAEVRIVDDAGNDLPERHVGEIAIRSDSLFTGYFRDEENTRRALRDGWYFSGDLGYMADEHLFITGRKKDLIIIAGKNYYPQDLERIVSDVAGIYSGRVVALGLDDPRIGTQRLIVLAEVDDPSLVDSQDLATEVRAELSRHLDCVIDDLRLLPHMWLLKTSSGKIARAPNLQRYQDLLLAEPAVCA